MKQTWFINVFGVLVCMYVFMYVSVSMYVCMHVQYCYLHAVVFENSHGVYLSM